MPSSPLGLLGAFTVSADVLSHVQAIADFDLYKVMEQHARWCREFAPQYDEVTDGGRRARLELDLKRFLALPLLFPKGERDFVPRYPVDLLWHAFILNTTLYRGFCDHVYGRFLDHVPSEDRAAAVKDNEGRPVEYTLECLNRAFGGYDRSSWILPIRCGCEFAFPLRARKG
jgi:hypothetical protein